MPTSNEPTLSLPAMFARNTVGPRTILRLGVGVVVRDDRGWILLEQRADCGWWGLPGGRLDVGESVTETAIREVKEETGLTVDIVRLLGIYSEPSLRIVTYPDTPEGVQLIDVVVEGIVVSGTLQCSHESLDVQFMSPDSLPTNLVPPSRLPIRDVLAGKSGQIR